MTGSFVPIRPKLYDRVLFDDRPGMGEWVRELFRDVQEDLVARFGKMLGGAAKDTLKHQIKWGAGVLRDIDEAMGVPAEIQVRRFRLWRGGQADWVASVLRNEQEDLYEDLDALRREGKKEDNPEVMEVVEQLRWAINLLRDVDACRVGLTGPDEDPR